MDNGLKKFSIEVLEAVGGVLVTIRKTSALGVETVVNEVLPGNTESDNMGERVRGVVHRLVHDAYPWRKTARA